MDKYEGYKIILQERLSEKRYKHSLNVADTAAKLAIVHNMDADKAYLAGLMHDYAKNLSGDELLEIAQKNDLLNDDVEILAPHVLHGPVGAYLLKKENIVTDEEVLQAISLHTIGSEYMTPFDALVYIADYIEPGRNFGNVDNIRAIAYKNLEFAFVSCLESVIAYLLSVGGYIHPAAIKARNAAISRINTRNSN